MNEIPDINKNISTIRQEDITTISPNEGWIGF
jgi:hypothetical protein